MAKNFTRVLRIGLGGVSCAGSSSVALALRNKLGVEMFSSGGFARELARQHGIDDLNNDTLKLLLVRVPNHDELTEAEARKFVMRCEAARVNYVLEGRLPFLALQGIEGACTILLECNDLQERIRREMKRMSERGKVISADEARERLMVRDQKDEGRYQGRYKVNCFDRSNYHHWLETAGHDVAYLVNKTIELAQAKLTTAVA